MTHWGTNTFRVGRRLGGDGGGPGARGHGAALVVAGGGGGGRGRRLLRAPRNAPQRRSEFI